MFGNTFNPSGDSSGGGAYVAVQRAAAAQGPIATATPTKMILGVSVIDNAAMNDLPNSRVVCKRTGNYDVICIVGWASNANASPAAHAAIYKNGVPFNTLFLANSPNEFVTIANPVVIPLVAGDYLEAWGIQYSGINRNTYYSAIQAAWVSLSVSERL